MQDPVHHSQTSNQNALLSGLIPATNYSIRIRAYTSAGDSPWTAPTVCHTEEDSKYKPTYC